MQQQIHCSRIRQPPCSSRHGLLHTGPQPQPAARRRRAVPIAAAAASEAAALGLDYAPTQQPASPGFLQPDAQPVAPWVRPPPQTYTPPSVRDSGTLRPSAEWYPAWMRYRRREDNYVFWQDKFSRCSLDIPDAEKRWTLFSSLWYVALELKYFGLPPALRYLFFLAWRGVQARLYEAHKALVLWQAKLDAGLAARATGGAVAGFSRAMALRRLHWRNSPLAEALYLLNVAKTGRVHLLPPVRGPPKRPTFFFLF